MKYPICIALLMLICGASSGAAEESPSTSVPSDAPRIFLDLREAGETCSKHRVARLMRENRLRALHGYRTRRWSVGKPALLIPNLLQRQFTVTRRNKAWVTVITYIRTWQGWLYLGRRHGSVLAHGRGVGDGGDRR